MSQDTQPGELSRTRTVVEWKLPLPWILGVIGMFAGAAIGLYYQVGALTENSKEMKDQLKALQIAVNSGNSQSMTLAGEIAILRFRVETLEAERRGGR